jgi:hypothetical protein
VKNDGSLFPDREPPIEIRGLGDRIAFLGSIPSRIASDPSLEFV